MTEITVKLRNSNRIQKRESLIAAKNINHLTPPKYTNKNSLFNRYSDFEAQKGYDYEFGESRVMKWMKE